MAYYLDVLTTYLDLEDGKLGKTEIPQSFLSF